MSGLPVKHIDAASVDANGRTRHAHFIRSQVLEVPCWRKIQTKKNLTVIQ